MSRTAGRRASRHLESTVEDAAVLFSSLLASPAQPLPAAVAAAVAVSRGGDQSGGSGGGGDSFSQRGVSSSEAAAAAAAGLDWLSSVFRLGLACQRAVPGEAAAALASAPEATAAALTAFLTAAGTTAAAAVAPPPERFLRRARRAEAGARWLGCRLLALGCGGGRAGGWRWAALRRDCALQVRARELVGLVA